MERTYEFPSSPDTEGDDNRNRGAWTSSWSWSDILVRLPFQFTRNLAFYNKMTLADEKPMSGEMEKGPESVSTHSALPIIIDSPEERRLVRKLDGRIMPIACVLYLFACECRLSVSIKWILAEPPQQILIERIWAMLVFRDCPKIHYMEIPQAYCLTG